MATFPWQDRPAEQPPPDAINSAQLWGAMNAYLRLRLQVEAAEQVGKAGMDRFFPSGEKKRTEELQKLDIIAKKRSLGLPMSDEDYEYQVNQEKPFINPGEALTISTALLRGKGKPLLNLFPRAKNVGSSGTISKLFGY
jgi:hypothetical protein